MIDHSSSEATTQILQILLTFSSTAHGAHELLELDPEAISPMLELSVQQPLVLEILHHTFLVGVTLEDVSHEMICSKLNEAISALIRSFRNAETTQLFIFLDNLLDNVPAWVRVFMRQDVLVDAKFRNSRFSTLHHGCLPWLQLSILPL